MPRHLFPPVRHVIESPRCRHSNGTFYVLLASVPAKLQAAMEVVFTVEFLLTSKTDISMPNHSLMPVRHVPESSRCQPSNGTFYVLLASVPAKLQAAMKIVFPSEFLLNLKTDISTSSDSTMTIRYASVPTELQAAIEMVFTSEFLLNLKTNISMPNYSLTPVRHVPESPRCQLSNSASHVLLASVPAELQAAMKMIFTSEFLLTLKTDISTPSDSPTHIRHVPDSSRCWPSNGASHALLASVPTEIEAAMKMVFADISTPSHSLSPVRHVPESPRCQLSKGASYVLLAHVPESPRCQLSNGGFYVLLAPVPTELQAAMKIVFTSQFLLNLKTDISMYSDSPAPIRYIPESPRCRLPNGASHILLPSFPSELQAAIKMAFTGKFLLNLKTDISTPSYSLTPIRYVPESP
ncbi:hypothetical protein L873DRAFT_1794343 [Choiromyces venosus 120613-1]|uniref:Uncharacterized protein n=1 Tax=Choiromyces venosus 120613-1 TaxID=1336337 RepID=A0A3N4J592_9PEZI|nr:hypothetical protein L873DRAFT_1794343 [Choiromyces venosus 120613-1]